MEVSRTTLRRLVDPVVLADLSHAGGLPVDGEARLVGTAFAHMNRENLDLIVCAGFDRGDLALFAGRLVADFEQSTAVFADEA